ncbi:MAG: signal recognition particle-docking protein FtsY [FCB group bacterium]|nr:signal recognition particle-docking protein FtsY [FCB group bacterium]
MISFFKKTFSGLRKTRQQLAHAFARISGKTVLSPQDLETLEAALLQADLGWQVVEQIMDRLSKPDAGGEDWEARFITTLGAMLPDTVSAPALKQTLLLVGVNGTGKTTTAAKLAGLFSGEQERVMLIAADTYRAAAVEQLKTWSNRLGVHLMANTSTKDPAAVTFDGITSGLSKNYERLIVDTAGRLHTSANLMKELEKIYRVARKKTADISVLITIDANTGQNGIQQAREFNEALPIDGVILTKMDGTARGGIAVPIMLDLNLPVYYLGVGEQVDDLIPFDQRSYLKGLIGLREDALLP